MKKLISSIGIFALVVLSLPNSVFAAGISASGGGTKTVGQTFTVSVVASGAEFNAFQGTISTSGPVTVVSATPGSANWMSQPSANGSFSGALLGQKVSSFTIATIKLKGTKAGTGAVSVSGVILKNGATTVSTSGGSASFTIAKAPELPGAVKVSSSTHPDQAIAYEATTISLEWTKESGVDNFSYLLDQAEATTPPSTATDANTSVTYSDKAIGVYYFHIKAHKTDGWGSATHFKITIKEPDAKIDPSLDAPSDIHISKGDNFENNVANGTVTGLKISGKTLAGYSANITLTPEFTLPEGKTMTAVADQNGNFTLTLDFPIAAGFHKITIQGQKEKVLTPISDEVVFEISQAKGGAINTLTSDDAKPPVAVVKSAEKKPTLIQRILNNKKIGLFALLLVVIVIFAYYMVKYYRKKSVLKKINIQSMDIKKPLK